MPQRTTDPVLLAPVACSPEEHEAIRNDLIRWICETTFVGIQGPLRRGDVPRELRNHTCGSTLSRRMPHEPHKSTVSIGVSP